MVEIIRSRRLAALFGLALVPALAVSVGPDKAQAAESAWEKCVSSAGSIIQGCHRIATYNIGNPDYWPYGGHPNPEGGDPANYYPDDAVRLDAACADGLRPPGIELVASCKKYGAWQERKGYVRKVVADAGVDILGVQELNNETVWSEWSSTMHRSSTYRNAVIDYFDSSLNLTYVTGSGGGGSQIFYNASKYRLLDNGSVSEKDLLGDTPWWNDRGVTIGEQFAWAKLQRKGVPETSLNTVIVASVHLPSASGFPAGADVAGYQTALAKRLPGQLGKYACKATTCSGTSITSPQIPVVVMGDFNSAYGTGSAPQEYIDHPTLKFKDPRYAGMPSWSDATKEAQSTSIRSKPTRKSGRVIDYVLYKSPGSMFAHGANESARALELSGSPGIDKAQRASDHRMVKLSLWMKPS